jgi:hypothetical protein
MEVFSKLVCMWRKGLDSWERESGDGGGGRYDSVWLDVHFYQTVGLTFALPEERNR